MTEHPMFERNILSLVMSPTVLAKLDKLYTRARLIRLKQLYAKSTSIGTTNKSKKPKK